MKNTSRDASKSLLMEIICHHLGQLADSNTLNFKVGLVNGHACTKKLRKLICDMLDVDEQDVHCNIESRFNEFGTCRSHDLVLYLWSQCLIAFVVMMSKAGLYGRRLPHAEFIIATLVDCKLQPNKIKVLMPMGYRYR